MNWLRDQIENPQSLLAIIVYTLFAIMLLIGYFVTWPVEEKPEYWRFLCWLRIALTFTAFGALGAMVGHLIFSRTLEGLVMMIVPALFVTMNPLRDVLAGEHKAVVDKVVFVERAEFASSARYNMSTYQKKYAVIRFADQSTLEIAAGEYERYSEKCRAQGGSVETLQYLKGLERIVSAQCGGSGTPEDVDRFYRSQSGCDEVNDALSCYYTGKAYERGVGVAANAQHARAYFRKSCELGFDAICNRW